MKPIKRCPDCHEIDVRPEDGRHDWAVCGAHLLRQRDEARIQLQEKEKELDQLYSALRRMFKSLDRAWSEGLDWERAGREVFSLMTAKVKSRAS